MNPRSQHDSALIARAVVPGCVVGLIVVLLAAAGVLDPEGVHPWIALGAGIAMLTGALGAALKARAVTRRGDDTFAGSRLQIALLGDFVVQIFAVGAGTLGLHLSGLKFEGVAGFAVAFASVAVAHQAGSAVVLARMLRKRAAAIAAESATRSAEKPRPAQHTTPSASTHA